MATIRTNRQLGQVSLRIQRAGNILSPAKEMDFSIRQQVVSHGHNSYESNESTTRTLVSLHIQNVGHILSPANEMDLYSTTGRITRARFVRIE